MTYAGALEYYFWLGVKDGSTGSIDDSRLTPWSDKNDTAIECCNYYRLGVALGEAMGLVHVKAMDAPPKINIKWVLDESLNRASFV